MSVPETSFRKVIVRETSVNRFPEPVILLDFVRHFQVVHFQSPRIEPRFSKRVFAALVRTGALHGSEVSEIFFLLGNGSSGLRGHPLKLFKPRHYTAVRRSFFSLRLFIFVLSFLLPVLMYCARLMSIIKDLLTYLLNSDRWLVKQRQ